MTRGETSTGPLGTDPRNRFSGLADGYARFRPGYPPRLVEWLISEAGISRDETVADVGCGTGILTRMLASRGLRVVGVDPSDDMLAVARRAGGGAEYRHGDAATTGLPGRSMELVTVAQAFHWFDVGATLQEMHRILKPGGHVAALWNMRAQGTFMSEYDALLRHFSSEYRILESWATTLESLKLHPRVVASRERWEVHAQHFDWDGLRGRAWSSSYVHRGVQDRRGFDSALKALFDRYSRNGSVDFPYRTVALLFGVGAPPLPEE
jgi:SAM-dependent methyltransferase